MYESKTVTRNRVEDYPPEAGNASRRSQVTEQMDYLEDALSDAEKTLEGIFEAVQPICRQSGPEPTAPGMGKVSEILVPLADSLRNRVDRLRTITRRMQELRGRLEI